MIGQTFSSPVLITGIVALFFVLLALIVFARGVTRHEPRERSASRRLRVGIFFERDHETPDDDVEQQDVSDDT